MWCDRLEHSRNFGESCLENTRRKMKQVGLHSETKPRRTYRQTTKQMVPELEISVTDRVQKKAGYNELNRIWFYYKNLGQYSWQMFTILIIMYN